jgi:hypothetical protein
MGYQARWPPAPWIGMEPPDSGAFGTDDLILRAQRVESPAA